MHVQCARTRSWPLLECRVDLSHFARRRGGLIRITIQRRAGPCSYRRPYSTSRRAMVSSEHLFKLSHGSPGASLEDLAEIHGRRSPATSVGPSSLQCYTDQGHRRHPLCPAFPSSEHLSSPFAAGGLGHSAQRFPVRFASLPQGSLSPARVPVCHNSALLGASHARAALQLQLNDPILFSRRAYGVRNLVSSANITRRAAGRDRPQS